MAKRGIITAPTGSDAAIKAIAQSEPKIDTLAGTVRDAFASAALDKQGLINLASRKAIIVPAGTAINAALTSGGLLLLATITPDDATRASSPQTATLVEGLDTAPQFVAEAIESITLARKPTFSVESLVNAIEDAHEDADGQAVGNDQGLIVVVDQTAQTIRLYVGTRATVAAVDLAATYAEEAAFEQTLTQSGGRQYGE